MNRFPEKYEKPGFISLDEGINTGWSAECVTGGAATTPPCSVGGGASGGKGANDGFIDPEILRQGL